MEGYQQIHTTSWTYGCILMQYVTGLKPYEGVAREVINNVLEKKTSPLEHLQHTHPFKSAIMDANPFFKHLLISCFDFVPEL